MYAGKILYEFDEEKKQIIIIGAKVNNKEMTSLSICFSSGSLASGPSSYEVASPASQELYVFDWNGTHQFTMSLVTGDYKYNFSYRLVCFENKQNNNFTMRMNATQVYISERSYLVCFFSLQLLHLKK